MCLVPMKIKSISPSAPKYGFIPCGKCEECRDMAKNAWSWRLGAEFEEERKKGMSFGFCTLTFKKNQLPFIPKSCFIDPKEFRKIPCFDKKRCRDFILNLRRALCDDYGLVGCKYMFTSEYGSDTSRPHHHFIISFDEKKISAQDLHALVKKYWSCRPVYNCKTRKYDWKPLGNGFIIPKDYQGGKDSKGHDHKPFKIENNTFKALSYTAKYCCKDLNFLKTISGVRLDTGSREFKNCAPFHLQSRSLGLSVLKGLNDEQKLDLFLNGLSVLGSDKRKPIPLYIRNKILFNPKYVLDASTGKRLVRRDATAFFKQHCEEIFKKKTEFYKGLIDKTTSLEFWRSHGMNFCLSGSLSQLSRDFMSSNFLSSAILSEDYLAYYGVPKSECLCSDRSLMWLKRYDDGLDLSQFDELDSAVPMYYDLLDGYFTLLFSAFRFFSLTDNAAKMTAQKRLVEKVSEFHKQITEY